MLSFINVEFVKLTEIQYSCRSLKVSPLCNGDIHSDLMLHCCRVSGPSHNKAVMHVKQEIVKNLRTPERKELYHNTQTEILDHEDEDNSPYFLFLEKFYVTATHKTLSKIAHCF